MWSPAAASADFSATHLSAGPHIHRALQSIWANGAKAGLALNPGTPIDAVDELLDMICVMTVNPGGLVEKIIHSQIAKVRRLRALSGDSPIHTEVDGGVDPTPVPLVSSAGADVLAADSAVFRGGSIEYPSPYGENIRATRAAAESALAKAA